MSTKPSSSAADGRRVMTRSRARLEGEGNPGTDPGIFLLDPNAPRGPRDIVIEEEEVVCKIEVKDEPVEEMDLVWQEVTEEENEPARKRIKVEEDGDIEEVVMCKEDMNMSMAFLNVNEVEEHELEQTTDDVVSPGVLNSMSPTALDIEANVFQEEKVYEETSTLNSLAESGTTESGTAAEDGWNHDRATAPSDPADDPGASAPASSQVTNEGGGDQHDTSQSKILKLFPEVIKVYWEKYARFQPNSRHLLNLNCRRACKIWKEGMDEILKGEYTPVRNIHPTVIIPHGNFFETVIIMHQVLEDYKNVDLTVCPFPPRILEIKDQNTTQTAQHISWTRFAISDFLKKFGSGLKEFKYYGIMGEKKLHQYTSAADWYQTVVGNWIGKMPNLEKLTMRNSLGDDLSYPNALFRRQQLIDELTPYAHLFPKLQNLKSFDKYLMPLPVIAGAASRVNTDKTRSSLSTDHPFQQMWETCTKLKSQEEQKPVKDVSFFFHMNRYDPSSI